MPRPPGLRSLRTIQSSMRRGKIGTREQSVAELARLENERARLNRELAVWEQNRRRTAEQLQRLENRLFVLQQSLAIGETSRPQAAKRDDPSADPLWSGISLEY